MNEKPQMVLSPWIKGEPLNYKCSACSYMFIPPEDRSPKEGMAEVWAAFTEHVSEEHSKVAEAVSV